MKKSFQRLLSTFGYKMSRLPASNQDPFAAMQRLLKGVSNPIIFDVGAHHGHISSHFRDLFPSSTVYSFEPFYDSFEKLQLNTASDPSIKVFNFGLAETNSLRVFHSNSSSATNSLYPTDEFGPQTWGPGFLETHEIIRAEFKTIDSVLETMSIPRIDILKLDVQGAEPLVLAGALSACKSGIIGLIYSEIILQPAYSGQLRFDESLASFYSNGFDLFNIYNMSFTREGRLCQVDATFTRKC
jgi:FkbM family methyltransferase